MSLSRTPGIHPIQNTSSVLISDNSVFDKGRVILETDTNRVKTGDGVSTYTELTYVEWNYEIVEAAGTDTYTGNFSKPFFLAYFPMMRIRVRFTNANTGAATINLNGLGAIAIRKSVSTALSAGDIMAGGIYELCYDGTNFQIPAAVGGTASTPSLTATYVGFGSGANVLTGSADLVWTGSQLTANGTISSTGYKISGAAATGTILRGNGTSYVASTNTYPNTTGAGQILYATSANVIGSATDFVRLTTGEVVLGATALIGSEVLSIQRDQNAATYAFISNTTSGTAAASGWAALISGGVGNIQEVLSAGFTTSGIRVANTGVFRTAMTAGMNIGTTSNSQLSLWTNNTERARLLNTGEFLVGLSALASTEFVSIQKNQNALTWGLVSNTTSGTAGRAAWIISNSATAATSISIQSLSAGYTSSGILVADAGILVTSKAAGMNVGTNTNTQLSFWTNNTKKVEISAVGNMSLGGVATRGTTVGTNAIQIFNGTAPVGTLTNGVSLFSAAGKLKGIDAAGTVGWVLISSAVTTVNPTNPDRTLTVEHNGTTYYIHCKTTND